MWIPLDFSTANKWDIYTSAYIEDPTGSLSSLQKPEKKFNLFTSRCELEATVKTGLKSGIEFDKAVAECKLKQKESGQKFMSSLTCETQCKNLGTKPEDMDKCVAQCKLARREQVQGYSGQGDWGAWLNSLLGKNIFTSGQQPPQGDGGGGGGGDTGMGINPLSALIGLVLVVLFIMLIVRLMKHQPAKS